MDYWLISDTHFNHTKLEEWGGRSGDWQERLWRGLDAIPADHTLIHLGDVCIGDDANVHEDIQAATEHLAQRVLVRGNHDNKSVSWYLDHGWDFVCDGLHLEWCGETLLITHRPMHPDMWRFTRNIHGHTHGNLHRAEEYSEWYSPEYHIDISPELVGFKPVKLETLLKNKKQVCPSNKTSPSKTSTSPALLTMSHGKS